MFHLFHFSSFPRWTGAARRAAALALAAFALAGASHADSIPIYQDPHAPVEARVNDLFQRLTPDERLTLLTGTGFATRAVARVGLPPMHMSNGGQGVGSPGPATAFPSGGLLAASWDPNIVREVGSAIGVELLNKSNGTQMLLGPGMNIHRTPLNGRFAEYFSEDPFLAAEMAVGFVQGAQSTGASVCVKHFDCNNQEFDRQGVDVMVSERALREIYLPAFQAAVQRGHAWSVMTSYNMVNGYHSSANWYLVSNILKNEWGFDGLVMSDWGGVHETAGTINAGNDLEMPGAQWLAPDRLTAGLTAGLISQAKVDDAVHRLLRTVVRVGLLDGPKTPDHSLVNSDAHKDVAYRAAAAGMVLLKNTGGILPINPQKIHSIAVIGSRAENWQIGVGGSAGVKPAASVFPLAGITARAGSGIAVTYTPSPDLKAVPAPTPASDVFAAAVAAARQADMAIVIVGTDREAEESDRKTMALPDRQDELIREISAVNPRTVVVMNNGGPCLMADWISQAPAVLDAWFPGQQGGQALAAILFGDINPSGKLPDTLAVRREDYSDYATYPEDKNGVEQYSDGIYVGYRHFDKSNVAPVFPFGYGLSYTTFRYSKLRLSKPAMTNQGQVTVTADITNTGTRAGAEVVELYVHPRNPKIDRPIRELKGFSKLALRPGETKSATFVLTPASMQYCDVNAKGWKSDAGIYDVEVAASSRDIRLSAPLRLTRDYFQRIPGMGAQNPMAAPRSLTLGKLTTASSEKAGDPAKNATDGNDNTRWESDWSDPQWLAVDLGKPMTMNRAMLVWERARAGAYTFQVSTDGTHWTDVYSYASDAPTGSTDGFRFTPVTARWVRLLCRKRATTFGYSLYAFNVYGN